MQQGAATTVLARGWPPQASAVLVSLLLHAALLALLLVGRFTPPLEAPLVGSISVDLISMPPFGAMIRPARPPQPLSEATPSVPTPAPMPPATAPRTPPSTAPAPARTAPANGPFRATTFYAARLLAEPESAELRRGMRTLSSSERAVQLCDIEAMQQIRRVRPDYDPDMVVAYAMADMAMQDGTLLAQGGAFRSRREWYEISFRCTPTHDLGHVQAFEFTLGAAIPHEQWEAHYLTAEESEE